MKDIIKVPFGVYYNEQFGRPIRKKRDIVQFILNVVSVVLIKQESEVQRALWIKKEKMNRVFCFLGEKYFSTVFPFEIESRAEGSYRVYDVISDTEIDNRTIVLMERMLALIDFERKPVETIIEDAYLDVAVEGYASEEVDQCFGLILRLLTMELGYIRYDYDPKYFRERIHPLHHMDINYSSAGTYKLGLTRRIQMEEFIDMLDVKTECRYIQGL